MFVCGPVSVCDPVDVRTQEPSVGSTRPATRGNARASGFTAALGIGTGAATVPGSGNDAPGGGRLRGIGGELVATRGCSTTRGLLIVTGRPRGAGSAGGGAGRVRSRRRGGEPGTARGRARRPGLRPGSGTGAAVAGIPGGHHGPYRVSMQTTSAELVELGQNSAPIQPPRRIERAAAPTTVDGGMRSGIDTPPGRPGMPGISGSGFSGGVPGMRGAITRALPGPAP